jgi:hypothetical protein
LLMTTDRIVVEHREALNWALGEFLNKETHDPIELVGAYLNAKQGCIRTLTLDPMADHQVYKRFVSYFKVIR